MAGPVQANCVALHSRAQIVETTYLWWSVSTSTCHGSVLRNSGICSLVRDMVTFAQELYYFSLNHRKRTLKCLTQPQISEFCRVDLKWCQTVVIVILKSDYMPNGGTISITGSKESMLSPVPEESSVLSFLYTFNSLRSNFPHTFPLKGRKIQVHK